MIKEAVPRHLQADHSPDVSVVVVNYNTAHLLERMFAALKAGQHSLQLQIIVVDNASTDESINVLQTRFPEAELTANTVNVGFGRANNQAFSQVRGRYILLLNTDAFISADTLTKTVGFMDAQPRCGVLGVKLIGRDGSLQPSCRYSPTPWNVFLVSTGLSNFFPRTRLVDDMAWDHGSVRECDWVPGCYYLVRREVIDRVGIFDPRFFMYYEEVDHCRRIRNAGWSVIYYPYTQVVHLGGESAGSVGALTSSGRQIAGLQIESELLYFRKHFRFSGVLSSVLLTTAGDLLRACNALMRRLDTGRAAAALGHTATVIKIFARSRFATRPTR